MPGCVLRATGVDFEVDEFLKASEFSPCNVYRKGEPRGRSGLPQQKSGLTVIVSEASGDDLPQQIEDAQSFIKQNEEELKRLLRFVGVEGVTLDFGVWQKSAFGQFCYFPPDFLRRAGELGLGVELSVYVGADDDRL